MDPTKLAQIEEVYHAVLELEPDERSVFLAGACAGDPELRREVESLVSFTDVPSELIDQPPLDLAADFFAQKTSHNFVGATFGRYQILEPIGTGGMGEVFLARDNDLGRKVAIKLIDPVFAHDADRLQRFLNEAKTASALNHPNILIVHEIGTFEDRQFIATEFIAGETLAARMRREPLDRKTAWDIARQIASALQAAHDSGIVHRDIKPENVMIRPDGLVKVLDFGLAKPVFSPGEKVAAPAASVAALVFCAADSGATNPGLILGTANYMSPEQAQGKAVDARSDIFSFGVLLCELMTGRRPFAGDSAAEVMQAIIQQEPASTSELAPDLPPEIARIIDRTLRKDPDQRYQTAEELLIDLQAAAQIWGTRSEVSRLAAPLAGATAEIERNTPGVAPVLTSSSAEYLVQQVKQHKRGFALALALPAVLLAIFAVWFFSRPSAPFSQPGEIRTIAVMPFANTSGDVNTEYLSDGISEALINELSKLPGVKVIARDSAFKFKGQDLDLERVARELGVQAVVTGRMSAQGDRLQINAELVDLRDRSQMWGASYTRTQAGLLQMQDDIVREVAARLRPTQTSEQQRRLAHHNQVDPRAYELLLQGRYHQTKSTVDSWNRALDYYQQALKIDPNYALAHATMANLYLYIGANGFRDPKEMTARAQAAAQRALELDETLAEVHVALAGIRSASWDWSGAEREYRRALELNPNLSAVHFRYAFFLSTQGDHVAAIAEVNLARDLDPLKPHFNDDIAMIYYFARQYDRAIEQAELGLSLDPNFGGAHYMRGFLYDVSGQYAEAAAEYREMLRLSGEHAGVKCYLGFALARAGRRGEAEKILNQLLAGREYVSPVELSLLHLGLGDREKALAALERGYAEHDSQMQFLRVEPHFDELRSEPRFVALAQKVGLP